MLKFSRSETKLHKHHLNGFFPKLLYALKKSVNVEWIEITLSKNC